MKGTEKIIAHIQADADAQVAAILAEAEKKCAAISAEYEAKAKEAYSEKIRLGVKECEAKVESMGHIADMEAKKNILSLKQDMVSKSFELAVKKIVALPEAEYVEFLAKLAADAASTGSEEIILNAVDNAKVGSAVVKAANAKLAAKGLTPALTLSDKTGAFAGGLIMKRGNIEVNCTVELLVELCRGEMSAKLAGVLFA